MSGLRPSLVLIFFIFWVVNGAQKIIGIRAPPCVGGFLVSTFHFFVFLVPPFLLILSLYSSSLLSLGGRGSGTLGKGVIRRLRLVSFLVYLLSFSFCPSAPAWCQVFRFFFPSLSVQWDKTKFGIHDVSLQIYPKMPTGFDGFVPMTYQGTGGGTINDPRLCCQKGCMLQ